MPHGCIRMILAFFITKISYRNSRIYFTNLLRPFPLSNIGHLYIENGTGIGKNHKAINSALVYANSLRLGYAYMHHGARTLIQYENIVSSYQYRKSHCGDKTVVTSCYLYNGNSYTSKTASLSWIRPLLITGFGCRVDPKQGIWVKF